MSCSSRAGPGFMLPGVNPQGAQRPGLHKFSEDLCCLLVVLCGKWYEGPGAMSSQGGVTQGLSAAGLRSEFRCVRHLPCSCWSVFRRDRASVAKGGMIMHVCRLVPRGSEEAIFRTTFYGPLIFDNGSLRDALVQTSGPRCS